MTASEGGGSEQMTAIGFHEHGDVDKYEQLTVPKPVPDDDEVLIEVKGAALNHQDLFAVRELDHYIDEYPFWGGGDISGVISTVGSDVEGWEPGDRVVVNPTIVCEECEHCLQGEHSQCENYKVYGEHVPGGFAEYVKVNAVNLVEVPDDYDIVEAAAAPMAYGTAWRMLADRADVDPYDDVLIVGASGGIGTYATQIAKNVFNVDTLYATTSTDEKAELVRDLGADHVIDYTEEQFESRVWELTDKRGVDVVINNVGGETWVPALRSMRNGGTMVTSGATAGPNPETEIRLIFVRQLNILGSTTYSRQSFKRAMEYIWDGTVEPVIQDVLPFSEYAEGFEKMDNRELYGKVVLTPE